MCGWSGSASYMDVRDTLWFILSGIMLGANVTDVWPGCEECVGYGGFEHDRICGEGTCWRHALAGTVGRRIVGTGCGLVFRSLIFVTLLFVIPGKVTDFYGVGGAT